VPGARTLAILPLKSPKGVLGVLSLSRSHGEPPGPEERDTLEAICHQIAIAIQNIRLLGEIGRVEAQRELDRMKAEFISAVSHELRTPLGFIKGYATTLSREDISIDSTTRREFLQIIEEESDNLQRMIDDLLGASQLQAGRFQMDKDLASLKELLDSALRKAELRLQQSGHSLGTRLPDDSITVLVDAGRIEQVLHNLLDNASRYSPPGSSIEVESAIQDGHAIVRVKDFGVGVADHELERVFEPFYRGKNSQGKDVRGTGLGLAISRSIIQAHGGQIWAENNPDGGSTFSFTLPIAECPVVKSNEFPALDQEAPPGAGRPGDY
jgi:two-component system sensor histidine kinase KdpD